MKLPEEILFTRQFHEADRAGPHFDLRIVVGDKGYSWATKKEMPEPGGMIVLFQQPTHSKLYSLSKEIIIPKGQYGSGRTTLDTVKKAIVHEDSTEDKIKFTMSDGNSYLLKKLENDKYGDKSWLFRNITNSKNLKPNKYIEKIIK